MRTARFRSVIPLIYWCQYVSVVSGFTSFLSSPTTLISSSRVKVRTQHSNIVLREANVATTESIDVPIPTEWKGEVLKSLSAIIDPDLNRDIVTLGFIQNLKLDPSTRQISFTVELSTPDSPIKEEFESQCATIVNTIPWTNQNAHVTISFSPPPTAPTPGESNAVPHGLSKVRSIIAVSSCKGGVGKSTTAVNLAYSLSSLGASVGIFDADVYGPSLPTMITPDNDDVLFVGRQIAPLQRNGVKLMSFGYVNDGSAVMRGPMVTQLLDQFLSLTYWGSLDYLILDMPPGTGDIQLTLSQRVNITAAVVVTTPQELSFVDVERGIEMFDAVNVPCVAVVENMAYLDLNDENNSEEAKAEKDKEERIRLETETKMRQAFEQSLEQRGVSTTSIEAITDDLMKIVQSSHEGTNQIAKDEKEKGQIRIFGNGHRQRLSQQWGIDQTFSVPLLQKISANGDSGTPFVLEYPSSSQASVYRELADNVIKEVVKIQERKETTRPTVSYNKKTKLLDVDTGEVDASFGRDKEEGTIARMVGTLSPRRLRLACRCAQCVEELSGRQILKESDVSENVYPFKMSPTGNYALSVDWNDGHKSLYPFRQVRALMKEYGEETKRPEGDVPDSKTSVEGDVPDSKSSVEGEVPDSKSSVVADREPCASGCCE